MKNNNIAQRYRVVRSTVFAILVAFVGGCATSAPSVDTSASDEQTFDGLYPVRGSSADAAWARPNVDLSIYTKIKLQGVGIEYRPGGESGRFYNPRSASEYYQVTDEQKERFQALLVETFRDELGKSEHFEIVDEAGPDVLLIKAALLDVVSYVPPEPIGRNEIYLSRVGEATLVLELRDSLSDAILARAIDRRAAENRAMGFTESNRTTNSAEVRTVVRGWARVLRRRLDTYGAPQP